MNRFAAVIKPTVLLLLIFANTTFLLGQSDSLYRLPVGTRIHLKLDTELSSGVASLNDTFIAAVAKPVSVRGTAILPAGTVIEGRVAGVSRAGVGGRNGSLNVVFETLTIGNDLRPIDAVMITKIGTGGSRTFNLLTVLGSMAAGAALGGSARSNGGLLIGAGIGAAAGTGVIFFRKGKEAKIRKGQEFEIELRKEVVLPVLDY